MADVQLVKEAVNAAVPRVGLGRRVLVLLGSLLVLLGRVLAAVLAGLLVLALGLVLTGLLLVALRGSAVLGSDGGSEGSDGGDGELHFDGSKRD